MSEPFIGREQELNQLNALLDLALSGQGQLAFITGEAGAGKTALLREFTRRAQVAHPELLAAGGECNDLASQADPYLPFQEVLAQLSGDVEKALAQGTLTPVGADRIKQTFAKTGQVLVDIAPDLINIVIPGTRLVALFGKAVASRTGWLAKLNDLAQKKPVTTKIGAPSLSSDRVYEEYTEFLRQASLSQPLLIFLDDLQWTDAASAGLLFHLSRRINDRPILILGAFRPNDVSQGRSGARHPLEPVIHEVERYSGQRLIDLAPSSMEAARAFVDDILDSEPNVLDQQFRQDLCDRTEGHPIFVIELLRVLRERGDLIKDDQGRWVAKAEIDWSTFPERVEGILAERVARLKSEELTLLQAASVEGNLFIAEVVARLINQEVRQVVATLSTSIDHEQALISGAGVRRIGEQRLSAYAFRHNMVQEYLYQSLDAAQRAYLHEDVAAALLSLYGDVDDQIVGDLAWHYRQAGISDRAFHYAVLAGDRAAAAYANLDAVTQYTQAAEMLVDFDADPQDVVHLYRARGRALELSGDPGSALANYEAMKDLGQKRASAAIEMVALAAEATLLAVPTAQHNPEQALRLATKALEMAKATGDRAVEAQILWSLLLIHRFAGNPAAGVPYGEQSQAISQELGLREQLAFTLHDLSDAYGSLGDHESAQAAAAGARELWKELGNQPMLANSLGNQAQELFLAGELDRAASTADEVVRIGVSIGNQSAVSFGRTISGLTSVERGDVQAGLEALQDAVEAGRKASNAITTTGIWAELAWILAGLGRRPEAVNICQEAIAEAESKFHPAVPWTVACLARIHLLYDDLPAAAAALSPAGTASDNVPLDDAAKFGGIDLGLASAEIKLAEGDSDTCLAILDSLIDHLERIGARLYMQDVWLLRAKALLAQGKLDEARKAIQKALDVADSIASHRLRWQILDLQADLERSAGNLPAAQGAGRQAREEIASIADSLGKDEFRSAFLRAPHIAAVLGKA
ncbi:MAG: ATP-binding protein, partial [Anaerolineales bacterium]